MLEEVTAKPSRRLRPLRDAAGAAVKWGGRRLLDWRPEGSVVIALPNGQRIRFGRADGGDEPVLKINSYKVIAKAIRRGAIGFAESYMDGDIECADMTGLLCFFVRNRARFENTGRGLFGVRALDRMAHRFRRNSRRGSRRNISRHYDLGNDFFRHWLDPEMIYSSGYYRTGAETLEDAQAAKLKLILGMLDLSPGDSILEIGCGWGALARRAAGAHGASVTGVTLSREQLAHAGERADLAGLGHRCRFQLEDYRDVQGRYDHIVSIEMIEAVGEEYWPRYFQTLNERLKAGGTAVLQAITIDEARFERYRRSADFIQRYIFPGGLLPTPGMIEREAAAAGLMLDRVERFGQCYARTLVEWEKRFEAAWPQISKLGFDERFRRCWRYYLAYCEAGFREQVIDVAAYRLVKA